MKNHVPLKAILLVFGLLTSGSGCQLLQIPSYRTDASLDCYLDPADAAGSTLAPQSVAECSSDCPPGFLPPAPAWFHDGLPTPACWAAWRAKKALPEAPAYPRFHPLPTRPMFESPPLKLASSGGPLAPSPGVYGQLPSAAVGNQPWSGSQQPWSGSQALPPGSGRPGGYLPTPAPEPIPVPAPTADELLRPTPQVP